MLTGNPSGGWSQLQGCSDESGVAHENPQSTLLAVAQVPFKIKEAVLCQEEQSSGYLLTGGTVVRLSSMCPAYEGHLCDIVGCHPPHKCPRASCEV